MRRVKGRSATKIFQEFPSIKNVIGVNTFGREDIFCVTAGELTKEMIQEYLEHHFERKPNDNFDVE
jgi:putative transposase